MKYIDINKFRSLTAQELFEFEFNNSFYEIAKISAAFLVGNLMKKLLKEVTEILIPDTKYKKIVNIFINLILIIIISYLALLFFTIYSIKINVNDNIKKVKEKDGANSWYINKPNNKLM